MNPTYRRGLYAIAAGILTLPLLLYTKAQLQRPPRVGSTQPLFEGITYHRQWHPTPAPYLLHVVAIDLTAPGIEVQASPRILTDDEFATTAQTTSQFLSAHNLQIAINGNYFFPFKEKTPWNFYPHAGDPVNVVGEAIAYGQRYSAPDPRWPAVCFASNQQAQLAIDGTCPDGTQHAIAGREVLLVDGQPHPDLKGGAPYARVAIALNKAGTRLWLIVVDGKQPNYSQGITLAQLTQHSQALGADTALNLDGGGSATLVKASPQGAVVLNAPIHARVPGLERPVATQLGFRAKTLAQQ
ncbi:MAG: phosphodiester glycosidase family protein [Cyanobacteria bacterium P01_H01_bin.58]